MALVLLALLVTACQSPPRVESRDCQTARIAQADASAGLSDFQAQKRASAPRDTFETVAAVRERC